MRLKPLPIFLFTISSFLLHCSSEDRPVLPPDAGPAPTPTPTPEPVITKVSPITFTPEHGFLEFAQNIKLDTKTSTAQIRYTTDGSDPTEDHGTLIEPGQDIFVDQNTTLRAFAYQDGLDSTRIKNQSYRW